MSHPPNALASGSTPTAGLDLVVNPSEASPKRNKVSKQDTDLVKIARRIKSGKIKQIVVLTGAGISTSAGIPDFRSPDTGLYANLERLNLPFPEAVFELGYFKKNPVPFWTLAKDLYPGKYLPTPTHYFLTLLHKHSILKTVFTQNIDTLESLAGLPTDKIIEAHGSFASAHCLKCQQSASREYVLKAGVREGKVVKCENGGCGGLVKPDIVFFGEGLPKEFFQHIGDVKHADLVLIIGTSLQVHPFASLPEYAKDDAIHLLINREPVGRFAKLKSRKSGAGADDGLAALLRQLGLNPKDHGIQDEEEESGNTEVDEEAEDEGSTESSNEDEVVPNEVFWRGDADAGIWRLARELGWEEELRETIQKGNEGLRKKWEEIEPNDEGQGKKKGPATPANIKVKKIRDQVNNALGGVRRAPTSENDASNESSGISESDSEGEEVNEREVPKDQIESMSKLLAAQMKSKEQ